MYVCTHIQMPFLLKLSKVKDDTVNWSWGFLNLAHHSANSSLLCLNVLVYHLIWSSLLVHWCQFPLFQTSFRNPLIALEALLLLFVVQQNLSMHQKSPLKLSKKQTYLHSFHALFLKQYLNNPYKPESGALKNRLWLRHQSDRVSADYSTLETSHWDLGLAPPGVGSGAGPPPWANRFRLW